MKAARHLSAEAPDGARSTVRLRVIRASRFPEVTECLTPALSSGPCTRTECRYHLMHRRTAEHRLNAQRDCALSVANEGPHTMDDVAAILGVSREWIRRLEESALKKLLHSEELRSAYDDRLA